MYIKVDYSPAVKSKLITIPCAGAYCIYTKKHWWNKWSVYGNCSFASLTDAYSRAVDIRFNNIQIPKYF